MSGMLSTGGILGLALVLLVHALILRAAGRACRTPSRPGRILIGAAFGTACDVVAVAAWPGTSATSAVWLPGAAGGPGGGLTVGAVVAAVVATLSIAGAVLLAYPGRASALGFKLMGSTYLLTLLGGGAGLASGWVLGLAPTYALSVACLTVLLVGEVGWGVVSAELRDSLYRVPIEIVFGQRVLRLEALLDTGNQLRDPITNCPVVIVEYAAVAEILPPEVRTALMIMGDGDLAQVWRLEASPLWSSRFRVIPFASIGKQRGLLLGFRPDEIRVWNGRARLATRRVVIGLHNNQLSPEGRYKALLHPDVLRTAS